MNRRGRLPRRLQAWRFQATRIHLYGLSHLCLGGSDEDKDGIPEGCLNSALSSDYTIELEWS